MAFTQQYQTPELTDVLKTLAACGPSRPSFQQKIEQWKKSAEGGYGPSEYFSSIPSQCQPPQPGTYPPLPGLPHPFPYPVPPNHVPSQTDPQNPTYDPTTISPSDSTVSTRSLLYQASLIRQWPAAVQHVAYLLSLPSTVARIRQLIRKAHDHERQWWSGRQSLIAKLSAREASRIKLNEVLASVGGHINDPNLKISVDMEKELRLYDHKVWKASRDMMAATYENLERLGIPFFCIKESLVMREEEEREWIEKRQVQPRHVEYDLMQTGKIRYKELDAFKQKMVIFLEDMVKE
ncbi:MAG: hypothetical protein Q9209_006926 [Squamulea sp. 1 TL-2023]